MINKQFKKILLSKPVNLRDAEYAHGFSVFNTKASNDTVYGHSGGTLGVSANLDIYQDKGYIVVVLSNYSLGAWPIVMKARELIARMR